jgi:hypothetical protein
VSTTAKDINVRLKISPSIRHDIEAMNMPIAAVATIVPGQVR